MAKNIYHAYITCKDGEKLEKLVMARSEESAVAIVKEVLNRPAGFTVKVVPYETELLNYV